MASLIRIEKRMRWVDRPAPRQRGGGGVDEENFVFDTSRSTAPKLALVPGSPLYCD